LIIPISPVANQSLFTSPETLSNKFFSFNPTNSWLTEVSSKTMVTAKGYIIRGPENFSAQPEQLMKLVWDTNNGEKTVLLDLHQVLI
jgi:hypothetical protein